MKTGLLSVMAFILALAWAGPAAADDDQAGGAGIPARPETHGSPINNGINTTVEVLVLG